MNVQLGDRSGRVGTNVEYIGPNTMPRRSGGVHLSKPYRVGVANGHNI